MELVCTFCLINTQALSPLSQKCSLTLSFKSFILSLFKYLIHLELTQTTTFIDEVSGLNSFHKDKHQHRLVGSPCVSCWSARLAFGNRFPTWACLLLGSVRDLRLLYFSLCQHHTFRLVLHDFLLSGEASPVVLWEHLSYSWPFVLLE